MTGSGIHQRDCHGPPGLAPKVFQSSLCFSCPSVFSGACSGALEPAGMLNTWKADGLQGGWT